MRYDKSITFIKNSNESYYDPELGEWVEEEPNKITTDANVTDLGTNRSVTLFGSIKQGAKVIRTQPLFNVTKWDVIECEGKTYQLVTERTPNDRCSLIVEEVTQ